MKILKTVSLVLLAFVAINASAQNQAASPTQPMPQGPGKMDPQQMAQKMTANIKQNVTGITPDQESKILAVETDYSKGMMDARSSSGGDRDAMRSKMEPLRQTRDAKIKAILTADQNTQYEKMHSPHPMGGGDKGGN